MSIFICFLFIGLHACAIAFLVAFYSFLLFNGKIRAVTITNSFAFLSDAILVAVSIFNMNICVNGLFGVLDRDQRVLSVALFAVFWIAAMRRTNQAIDALDIYPRESKP